MGLALTPPAELGALCPDFELPSTSGVQFDIREFKNSQQPFLVAVICNHCPYVKAVETRLIALAHVFRLLGIGLVAISSNDSTRYPEDSFENMKQKKYPFPYLFDQDQSVAVSLGAVCTPDFFLYDKNATLRYRGRLDDNWKETALVTRQELLEAAIALKLNGELPLDHPHAPSMGCSLKWKV